MTYGSESECATHYTTASHVISSLVLKQVSVKVSSFLAHLFNLSFSTVIFPNQYKTNFIMPLIKKPGIVPTDVHSLRPITDIPVTANFLEQFVASQVVGHLMSNNLLPDHQSAYRSGFSTETTVFPYKLLELYSYNIERMYVICAFCFYLKRVWLPS